MSTLTKPKHKHDCRECKFLGQHRSDGKVFDLYYCPEDFIGPSLVYRFGSEGPAYGSTSPAIMLRLMELEPDMKVSPGSSAYKLALKRGLIDERPLVST